MSFKKTIEQSTATVSAIFFEAHPIHKTPGHKLTKLRRLFFIVLQNIAGRIGLLANRPAQARRIGHNAR
jgi:hypothetical protein